MLDYFFLRKSNFEFSRQKYRFDPPKLNLQNIKKYDFKNCYFCKDSGIVNRLRVFGQIIALKI